MRLIDKFAEEVLKNEGSFNITMKRDNKGGIKTYHFLQSTVGQGRYVYGICDYWDDRCYSKLDLRPKLVAIVSGGTVYIVDWFLFEVYNPIEKEEIPLPEHTLIFNSIVSENNEYLTHIVFPKFYDSLETVEIDGDYLKNCEQQARQITLSNDPIVKCKDFEDVFSQREVAEMLCGILDMKEEIKKRFEAAQKKWIDIKSFNKKVEELVETNATVEDWELAIAEGLRSVDAKTFTVEFEFNGKRASEKMNPYEIRHCMLNNNYFSGYNFVTTKSGDRLIKYLGAGTSSRSDKEVLTCKHISRITYGKKELYVRR